MSQISEAQTKIRQPQTLELQEPIPAFQT